MKELFDVHCHMVPGVDDGAADLEEMTTNTGTTKMASLPSTFCIFKPVYEKGSLSGYRIIGGGCLKHRQKRYMSSF